MYALAASGANIYVGGNFQSVGGQPRRNLAVVDTGGAVTGTAEPAVDGTVLSLLVQGDTLYAGGGSSTSRASTGRTQPHSTSPERCAAIGPTSTRDRCAPSPREENVIFVGGESDDSRGFLAASDAASKLQVKWVDGTNDTVRALASRGDTIHVGGAFTPDWRRAARLLRARLAVAAVRRPQSGVDRLARSW